jgi:predicted CXXCH cytochrome family protein
MFWRMKKTMPAAAALLLLSVQATQAGTILGSPHDFKRAPWKRSGEICLTCHVPHGTKTLPSPLWDLELTSDTFTAYSLSRYPSGDAEAVRPSGGIWKTCLSCHDGIVASEIYGGRKGNVAGHLDNDSADIAPGHDHPISFIYDSAMAAKNKYLFDPSTRFSGVTGSTGTIDADMLFSKRMECASCHDVHNTKTVPGTKLLVKTTEGSALCLTCHI